MPGLIEPSCSSSPLRVRMERLPLFLPASNGDFRDATMIVGDDQCVFSSSWQASLKARNGSRNPWSINCLIPENVAFSLA